MNIIMYLIMASLGFIFTLMSYVVSKPHKNIILENTLPNAHLNDPKVLAVAKSYRSKSLIVAFALCLFFLPMLWIQYDSILMTYLFLGLILSIGIFYFLQITHIEKMHQVKVKNNWSLPVEKKIIVDTKLVTEKNKALVSPIWFVPSFVLILLGAFISYRLLNDVILTLLPLIIGLAMLILFIILYKTLAKMPVRPITYETKTNETLNRIYRHSWSFMCVASSYFTPLLFLLMPLSIIAASPFDTILFTMIILLVLAYVVWTFWYLIRLRKKEDALFENQEIINRDDDIYWRYGIYNNPNDPRLSVPDRIGMNVGLNFGRPVGKVIYAALGIFLAGIILFTTIPMFQADFSDSAFAATVRDSTVTLKAPLAHTAKINLSQIENVESLTKMPENNVRIAGTATNHYLTGRFSIEGQASELFVYRKSPVFLKITTKDKIYYFADKDPEKTEKAIEILESELKNK